MSLRKIWNCLGLWRTLSLVLCAFICVTAALWRYYSGQEDIEVASSLGGNIFPSSILSTAVTGAQFVAPYGDNCIGNPQIGFGVRFIAVQNNMRVNLHLDSTPFFSESDTEFILPEKGKEYILFPDVIWDYDALRNNVQSTPVNIVFTLRTVSRKLKAMRTFALRSINDCLLGYMDDALVYHSTGEFFGAYVNEEHPLIDQLLREALDTHVVRRFTGIQSGEDMVEKQVYALWYMLQKRNFQYSSVANSTLSSNVVFCQRVRTLDDALSSSQINCVDGTVLLASLLRAINIKPVLVRIPGHMFIGYYSDKDEENLHFLETTMIGNVNLDDYFPDENLDSISDVKTQSEMSRITFDKAQEYAEANYQKYKDEISKKSKNTLFLEIDKELRSKVQSIGR